MLGYTSAKCALIFGGIITTDIPVEQCPIYPGIDAQLGTYVIIYEDLPITPDEQELDNNITLPEIHAPGPLKTQNIH